jgi:4-amino-4-deoxy-L-arabinose transferase-like glycosyltransferase
MSVVRGVGGIDRRALAQRALPATVLGTVSAALLWVLWRFMTPPLWFDEQWRARRISMPQGFWHDLSHTAAGPSSVAWLAVERAVVAVLGDRELPLRLPLVAALPLLGLATYWLATRFVHRHVALVTAVLVTVNPPLLVYGLQLKPYVSEAAATATFVALWLAAQAAPPSWRRQLPYYTGMGALVLFGIPLLFLLPGLLGYQLGRSLRRSQGRGVRLGLATAVGVVGALHWLLFLRPQSRMLRSMSYWQPAYLPVHDGIEAALRFVLDRTVWHPRMLSSAGLLPPDVSYPGIGSLPLAHRLAAPVAVVADVAVTVALAIGVVWALRRRDLRPVPVAVGVALMAQLGISSHGLWPYGGNRTNLFLLPVLAVLVAAGMAATFRWAWGRPTRVVLAACLALGVATTLPIQAGRR